MPKFNRINLKHFVLPQPPTFIIKKMDICRGFFGTLLLVHSKFMYLENFRGGTVQILQGLEISQIRAREPDQNTLYL